MTRQRKQLWAVLIAGGLAAGSAAALAAGGPHDGMSCGDGYAQTQAPGMGHGGRHGGGMMEGPHHGAMKGDRTAGGWDTQQLAKIKPTLQLQPEQMPAWNAYEARVDAQRAAQAKRYGEMRTLRGQPEAMAEFRLKALQADAQAAEEINVARKALVAVLTPAQKTTFEQARGPQRGAAQLAQMKNALSLQPNQTVAWNAFETQVKMQRDSRAAAMVQGIALRDNPEALADFRVQQMKARAQSATEIHNARQALIATLTPEQKATFERWQSGPGEQGPGGHRHGHGGMQRS
jgi:hypothetical protein